MNSRTRPTAKKLAPRKSRPVKRKPAGKKPRPLAVEAAAGFDEGTPPPRRRPEGLPVARYVELPPGESALGNFHQWDLQGRIPAGSVLAEYMGRLLSPRASGYVVAGNPTDGAKVLTPLGTVGAMITCEQIDGYKVRVVIREGKRSASMVVLSPKEAKYDE